MKMQGFIAALAVGVMLSGCHFHKPVPPEPTFSFPHLDAATQSGQVPTQSDAAGQPGSRQGLVPFGRISAVVVRVVDGDTLLVSSADFQQKHPTRVRLIGVDTPESVAPQETRNRPEGKHASRHTKAVLEGQTVELLFDQSLFDPYDRLLAYLEFQGQDYNATLLQEGWARLDFVAPNTARLRLYTALSREAERERRGFWSGTVFDRYRSIDRKTDRPTPARRPVGKAHQKRGAKRAG